MNKKFYYCMDCKNKFSREELKNKDNLCGEAFCPYCNSDNYVYTMECDVCKLPIVDNYICIPKKREYICDECYVFGGFFGGK